MLCDICKKKEAVIHYTEVVDNKVKTLHLCEQCAMEKGITGQTPFSIGELLGGLTPGEIVSHADEKKTCPMCGMTFSEFKEAGRLGCGKCYEAFSKSLIPLIRNIHKSTTHTGKTPSKFRRKKGKIRKIKELEEKLREAVSMEKYEKAAEYRDEIRALQRTADNKKSKKKGRAKGKKKGQK